MEGDGEGGGVTGPSAEWAGPLRPHTLWTASRGTAAAPAEPAPPATRGRWRRGAPADRSLRPGAPRRRMVCAAGSDGSGSCHVEGGWGRRWGGWGRERGPESQVWGPGREGSGLAPGVLASSREVAQGTVFALALRGVCHLGQELVCYSGGLKMPTTLPPLTDFSLHFSAGSPELLP